MLHVLPDHTIHHIKTVIKKWLHPQGIIVYTIRVFFRDNEELDPVVLLTDRYDNVSFYSKRDSLDGGKIYINVNKISPAKLVIIKGTRQRRKVCTKQIQSKKYKPPDKIHEDDEPQQNKFILPHLIDAKYIQRMDPIPEQILASSLPDKGGFKLRPHQLTTVRYMLSNRGLIVVHSVGSGKTLIAATSAMCALNFDPTIRIIFVAPKTLLSNFRIMMNSAYANPDWSRIYLYTYEKFHYDYSKGYINGYNTYLMVDEAHRLRTHQVRGRVANTVSSVMRCARKSSKVLLLTASPVVNDPYDIMNLEAIIRGDLRTIDKSSFRKRIYSKKGVIRNKIVFENTFKATVSIYDRPRDNTYPRVVEHDVKIPMPDKYYREYQRVETQHISDVQKEILGENDLKPFHNGTRRTVNADIEEYNPKLDWVRDHMLRYNNRKMIIFSPFISLGVKQLEQVVQDFDVKPLVGQITGSDTKDERQDVINRFNKDELQIVLISIGAGGLGISFKGTRDVVIMQPGWNIVEKDQAMGRAVRFHSHTHLPVDQQQVDVWNLLLVKPENTKGEKAIDEIIVDINIRKNLLNDPFIKHLKEMSIEKL